MGCCSSTTELVITNPDHLLNDILQKKLSNSSYEILSNFDKSNIDKIIIKINEFKTNALGLSILVSDFKVLKYLHTNLNASFAVLEDQLQYQNIQLMELAIDYFDEKIMKYYIPFYLDFEKNEQHFDLDHTLNFASICVPMPKKKIHPMRYAVETEKIDFLQFVLGQYRFSKPPECFSIHAVDEETGENCALVACKVGSLKMVEFLYRKKCNFRQVNKNGENALNLALLHRHAGKVHVIISILSYLVEVVGLDIAENYEESLMLSKHQVVTEYIEEKLRCRQVYVTKHYVECKYQNSYSIPGIMPESPCKLSRMSSHLSAISPIDHQESSINFM